MSLSSLRARRAEARLERALRRARAASDERSLSDSTATRKLRELAATLQSARPKVTSDSAAAKRHARDLASELDLDKGAAYDLILAAELHEVGKAAIPRDALYTPGELDAADRALVESHPRHGAELIEVTGRPAAALAVSLQNERLDGSGPNGIAGDELPHLARALTVVAAYSAMTSARPFRDALTRAHALEILRSESGTQFDSEIVEAFARTVPTRSAPVFLASAGAALARPFRGIRLSYQRHGRISTAAITAFASAVVVIGASGVAPDGIGRAIENVVSPDKASIERNVPEQATDSANEDAIEDTTLASGESAAQVASEGGDQVLGTRFVNTPARTTTIEGGHEYWVTTSGETESYDPDGHDETESYDPDGVEETPTTGTDEEEVEEPEDGEVAQTDDDTTTSEPDSGTKSKGSGKSSKGGDETTGGETESYDPDDAEAPEEEEPEEEEPEEKND